MLADRRDVPLRRRRHRPADAGVAAGRRPLAITAAHVTGRTPASTGRSGGRSATRSTGRVDGPLLGLRVAVKDLFAVRGLPDRGGQPDVAARRRPRAPARSRGPRPARGRRVGARHRPHRRVRVLDRGRNPHYGTPPNGAVPGALPGGSSSGPATAVATGQADVGLATDTAGSIRVPASTRACGGCARRTALVPRQGCSRWRRRSTRSAG